MYGMRKYAGRKGGCETFSQLWHNDMVVRPIMAAKWLTSPKGGGEIPDQNRYDKHISPNRHCSLCIV